MLSTLTNFIPDVLTAHMMNVKFILTILASCTIFVSALFEDQAGKFDWKQKYVGEATHMGYYSNSQTSGIKCDKRVGSS